MSYSSPVAIPQPKAGKRPVSQLSESLLSPLSIPSQPGSSPSFELLDSFSTCPCSDTCTANIKSEHCVPKSPQTDDSSILDVCDCHPFSPPRLNFSRSSSTISSLSLPSSPSLRLTRALSPPREEVNGTDPLRISGEPDETNSDDEPEAVSPTNSDQIVADFKTPKKPTRRKSQFKSSLTASLSALKGKFPASLPSPTVYTPSLLPSRPDIPIQHIPNPPQPLAASLPAFDLSTAEAPTSSAVHLQTYSVSLGPPRKPREARLNSDFLRLLALEMEMRRSGKFGYTPDLAQGIVVSEKVRMVLPRRCDRERDDVNMSIFNKSRLKW
jgi:hypothetical protein